MWKEGGFQQLGCLIPWNCAWRMHFNPIYSSCGGKLERKRLMQADLIRPKQNVGRLTAAKWQFAWQKCSILWILGKCHTLWVQNQSPHSALTEMNEAVHTSKIYCFRLSTNSGIHYGIFLDSVHVFKVISTNIRAKDIRWNPGLIEENQAYGVGRVAIENLYIVGFPVLRALS